jgi:hypothetical protein
MLKISRDKVILVFVCGSIFIGFRLFKTKKIKNNNSRVGKARWYMFLKSDV